MESLISDSAIADLLDAAAQIGLAVGRAQVEADTGRAMSQESVDAFKRAIEAFSRRDFDAVLEEVDPEVEWHPGLAALLGGEATVYRGWEGARQAFQIESSRVHDRSQTAGTLAGNRPTGPTEFLISAESPAIRTLVASDRTE